MDDHERDMRDAVDDLGEVLEAIRDELREPPDGPGGPPRPPSPREVLRFTERFAIPATIAVLEAGIRVLELLGAALRVADGRSAEAIDGATDVGSDRLTAVSRDTLERLDEALADLQRAVAGGEPDSPELQRLLSEARDLRAEVDSRLEEATSRERSVDTTDANPDDNRDEPQDVGIDVDSELDSIKRDLDRDDDEVDDGTDDAAGDGT